jgi:hypothetical protein
LVLATARLTAIAATINALSLVLAMPVKKASKYETEDLAVI